jgi:tetratricopeptide (TPR) repeat protein
MMRGWTMQLPNIGRLYRLMLVLSMPKSLSRARFSQRASWRKQRRVTWRPPDLDPKLAQPHNYLGKIFMREGDAPEAIAQFEQALRLHLDFPEAEENLRLAKAGDP